MHHSQLLDTAISPKMRIRLSSWSVLPLDVLLSVHRNLKDKYSLPLCLLPSSYSIFIEGKERQFIVYQPDVICSSPFWPDFVTYEKPTSH